MQHAEPVLRGLSQSLYSDRKALFHELGDLVSELPMPIEHSEQMLMTVIAVPNADERSILVFVCSAWINTFLTALTDKR